MFPPIRFSGQSLREGLRRPPVPSLKLADPVSSASPALPVPGPLLPCPARLLHTAAHRSEQGHTPEAWGALLLLTLPTYLPCAGPTHHPSGSRRRKPPPFRLGKEVSATPCPRDFPQGGAEAEREKKAESAPLLYGQPKCGGLKTPSKASSVSSRPLPALAFTLAPTLSLGRVRPTQPLPVLDRGKERQVIPHWRLDHNRGNCFKTNYWEPSAAPGIQR